MKQISEKLDIEDMLNKLDVTPVNP
ncbi:protein of unknown function [Shewanella benthica]|uniref:Uncharacterized protein n=1 Tax=Shewanella benthica TaxID=43661 RepID=A0A330MB92_9GAMM|nr:protein of unknown function [Shewanella benthica]